MGGKIAGPCGGVVISGSAPGQCGKGGEDRSPGVMSCSPLVRSVFVALPSCCSSMGCGAEI